MDMYVARRDRILQCTYVDIVDSLILKIEARYRGVRRRRLCIR